MDICPADPSHSPDGRGPGAQPAALTFSHFPLLPTKQFPCDARTPLAFHHRGTEGTENCHGRTTKDFVVFLRESPCPLCLCGESDLSERRSTSLANAGSSVARRAVPPSQARSQPSAAAPPPPWPTARP